MDDNTVTSGSEDFIEANIERKCRPITDAISEIKMAIDHLKDEMKSEIEFNKNNLSQGRNGINSMDVSFGHSMKTPNQQIENLT